MIVITCPGQGSQKPGFLEPFLADPKAGEWLGQVGETIKVDLLQHGTKSDAETIRDTAIAQPLIVAAGILSLQVFTTALMQLPTGAALRKQLIFAGHSVGEITAAYGAGVFDATTAMQFVSRRSQAMQECAKAQQTGMAAVLGKTATELAIELTDTGLSIANFNGAGQLVIGGSVTALNDFAANPPTGARVLPLQVAGAFHTAVMQPAAEKLLAQTADLTVANPHSKLLTNKDGSVVASGLGYLQLLINQVANPVRWDLCMETLTKLAATEFIELSPSGALAGIAKRAMPGVNVHKLNTPEDIIACVNALEKE